MDILIISCLTYILLGLALYGFGVKSASNGIKFSVPSTKSIVDDHMIYIMILFSIVCGLRWIFGTDTESYVEFLEQNSGNFVNSYDVEPLFFYITKFFNSIGCGRFIYLAFWAFWEIFFFLFALKQRKFLIPFAMLALIMGPFFQIWNNGLRQIIASLVFLYAVSILVDKKKWIEYLLLIGLCFTIHKSSMLLLPFVFIFFYDLLPSKKIALLTLGFCFFLGTTPFIDDYVNQLETILNFVGYSNYAYRIDSFVEMDASVTNYGPRRIVQLLSYVIVIFYSDKIDNKSNNDKFFRISYIFFLVYACGTEALLSKSTLFTRPLLYFYPFVLVCLSYLLHYLRFAKRKVIYIIATIIVCSYNFIAAIAEYNDPTPNIFRFMFMK